MIPTTPLCRFSIPEIILLFNPCLYIQNPCPGSVAVHSFYSNLLKMHSHMLILPHPYEALCPAWQQTPDDVPHIYMQDG